MPWIGVGCVFRPSVDILHDPIEAPAQKVLGPTLDVVQIKLLSSFLKFAFLWEIQTYDEMYRTDPKSRDLKFEFKLHATSVYFYN